MKVGTDDIKVIQQMLNSSQHTQPHTEMLHNEIDNNETIMTTFSSPVPIRQGNVITTNQLTYQSSRILLTDSGSRPGGGGEGSTSPGRSHVRIERSTSRRSRERRSRSRDYNDS